MVAIFGLLVGNNVNLHRRCVQLRALARGVQADVLQKLRSISFPRRGPRPTAVASRFCHRSRHRGKSEEQKNEGRF